MVEQLTEKELLLEVDGMSIPAALTGPETSSSSGWGILLIPGSFSSDVNGDYVAWDFRPRLYADLARQLAEGGHTVLRFAKTGPGTGSVVTDAAKAVLHGTFAERMVVAEAAFKLLVENAPGMKGYVLAGHSEGSLVAALLYPKLGQQVARLVNLSGPATPVLDNMTEQTDRHTDGGFNPAFHQATELVRRGEAIPAELMQDQSVGMYYGMSGPEGLAFLREVNQYDPSEAISRVDCPVLLVLGGADGAISIEDTNRLYAARQGKPTAKVIFPDLQHFYKQVTPDLPLQAAFTFTGPTDKRVVHAINDWLLANLA